jgi:hypothetical protein
VTAPPAPQGYVSHVSNDPLAVAYARAIEAFAAGDYTAASPYDDAVQQISPGEKMAYGQAEAVSFWRSMFTSLQVRSFTVEHLAMQCDRVRSDRPDRLALRFRAHSVHTPASPDATRFGPETGRPVELLGMVHAEFVKGRVVREWVLLDEVAIWMQILAQRV